MSYNTIIEMARSASLQSRVAAAAAAEGYHDPVNWAGDNMWAVVAAPGWAALWEYYGVAPQMTINVQPDLGIRTDVITDEAILGVVQPMIYALTHPGE